MEKRYKKLQWWSTFIIKYLGYKLEVEGVENIPLDEPILFVSNHQGTLDPALVIATCPKPMAFISKKKNEKLPVFGSWAITIGVIHFDHDTRGGNVYMLREAARELKAGKRLLIFPEGTRSRGDHMNPFKTGALQPAYLAKATLVPVTLNNAYCIDDKKDKNKNLKITYGKPIRHEEYKQYKYDEMSDIVYKEIEKNIIYHEEQS
ncbi:MULTISPECIES: lysophospholipid acyltransferase family protein [unclassified Breznakia]|uniref:lysophospholipid acyltransferase family protein n=1 Tax=unclassified Breznakia TaxID=2623764 RepID=UPI0024053324|nr:MULTISPECIES: lysophospholipid acyltransferase family protein [unclassified Breznakia]MDL2276196.1 1-acyl-sn-glycerol-3-phosphate acyltransferase [Breznakia sp. OttesenSCG-928-G09]